jgi:hypothetical protein
MQIIATDVTPEYTRCVRVRRAGAIIFLGQKKTRHKAGFSKVRPMRFRIGHTASRGP